MQEKLVDSAKIISNFEINKSKNKVILYVNPKIFPIFLVNKTAALFKDKSWVTLDSNEEEILVELKPKHEMDLEILAREFNNELLNASVQYVSISQTSDDLLSKIRQVIAEFIKEEQGKITKQAALTVGTILATLGFAQLVSASHLCPPPSSPSGDPITLAGEGGCEGGGGGGCCFAADELVLTLTGLEEISKIRTGSSLVSYDEKRESFTTSIVETVIVHDGKQQKIANFNKNPMIKLSVKVNDKINVTKVTDNHPYFENVENKYKPLKDFKVGDGIKTIEGEGVIIEKLDIIDERSPSKEHNRVVYNLHMMECPHNYIVNGAVVHNKDIENSL